MANSMVFLAAEVANLHWSEQDASGYKRAAMVEKNLIVGFKSYDNQYSAEFVFRKDDGVWEFIQPHHVMVVRSDELMKIRKPRKRGEADAQGEEMEEQGALQVTVYGELQS